jgi:hypothetical protein
MREERYSSELPLDESLNFEIQDTNVTPKAYSLQRETLFSNRRSIPIAEEEGMFRRRVVIFQNTLKISR